MPTTEPSAIVQQAEATEQQLIDRARTAVESASWIIGECASLWTERFARGRTDEDFAVKIGLTRDQVCQRRRVWDTFSGECDTYHTLSWSHFYAALNWDDAPECLQWADEMQATVAEMKAWRRAQRGEDLTQTSEPLPSELEEHDEPEDSLRPVQAQVEPVDDDDDETDDEPEDDEPYTPYRPESRQAEDDEDRSVASVVTREQGVDSVSVRTFSQRLDALETAVLAIEGHVQRTQVAARLRSIADRLDGD